VGNNGIDRPLTGGPEPRGNPLPIDPAIRSWATEAGIYQDAAWVYLGTIERTLADGDDPLYLDMVYHHPSMSGAYRSQLFLPSGALGSGWDGYRLELLGGVLRLKEPGFHIAPGVRPGPMGPMFRVLDASGDAWIEVELWRQRCWRPSGGGQESIPALVAELHWWPSMPIAHPFFRTMADGPNQLRPDDIRQARRDWAQLEGLPLTVNKGGRPEGSKSPDPEFEGRFYRALKTRYDDGLMEQPRQDEVAAALGVSVDTLQRRIEAVPLPWPPPWPPE
jgi:hypothetical protein